MKPQYAAQLEFVLVVIFILIPWYGPIVPRPPCPREKASLVRKVVTKRWIPILEKVGAALPLDCPLHPARDIFTLQESKKRHDSPQWTCGFCGKSFYHETHLDVHMENKHPDQLNDGEDTVCLADFCDVMRCEVLQERLRELEEVTPSTTALDVWHKPILLTSSLRSSHSDQAVEMALPRSLIRSTTSNTWQRKSSSSPPSSSGKYSHSSKSSTGSPSSKSHFSHHKGRAKEEEEPGEVKGYEEKYYRCEAGDRSCKEKDQHSAFIDPFFFRFTNDSEPSSEGPTERPIHPLHSWKDTCNEEQLAEIRVKCQQLIQQCVSGLILNLTFEQVKDVEGALHRAVCWYLTCERYWESGTIEPPEFPWGVVIGFVLLLTLGVSLCYYIVWVLCESTMESNTGSPLTAEPPKRITKVNVAPTFSVHSVPATSSSLVASGPSRGNSLGRSGASDSRARFYATESESECRDSGFNEGGLYPDYDPHETQMEMPSYRSRHYSEDSRLSLPPDDATQRYYTQEERVYNYASTFTPNYEQRRLRRNRYNYLDDFDTYSEIDGEGLDGADGSEGLSRERSDSFIYVSYPPEVKKKFTENR